MKTNPHTVSLLGSTKRKATTSLAAYDIELLKAWYTYNITEQGRVLVSKALPWLTPTCRGRATRCLDA